MVLINVSAYSPKSAARCCEYPANIRGPYLLANLLRLAG